MTILRRLLGLFVMIAGIIGLLLSLAGLAGIWVAKPVVIESINSTVNTLYTSVDTSQNVLKITYDALSATINSVDELSTVLNTTAATVEDTQPVITQVNGLVGVTLPETMRAATDSLKTAEQAAASLESAIVSFENFQAILRATPFLSALVPANNTSYNPEKPLADSLGELATSIEGVPVTLELMSTDLDSADDSLEALKSSLETMSQNVVLISTSLEQYQAMIDQSGESMENVKTLLTSISENIENILAIATIVLVLFFLWLLAAQVVIFSQGWELFQGRASRIDTGLPEIVMVDTSTETSAENQAP
jgi:chromosome segregation ATPase